MGHSVTMALFQQQMHAVDIRILSLDTDITSVRASRILFLVFRAFS